MQKSSLIGVLAIGLSLITNEALHGQSAYFQAVTNLNPIGYWPLNETTQPPAPFSFSMTASNSGTLGALGNGYYGSWYQPSGNTWYITNNILQSNGVAGAGDKAMWCQESNGQYVVVPRAIGGVANTNVTLVPPFTIEAWVLPNNTAATGPFGIVAEGGAPLNYGGPNTDNPYYGGLGTGWGGVVVAQYSQFFLFDCFATNGTSKSSELDSPTGGKGPVIGQWNHLVCTFDGAHEVMWINGTNAANKTLSGAAVPFAPDPTTPLLIGTGPEITAQSGEGGIEMKGVIDEVAIYNQILPQSSISNHYAAAFTTNYPNVVLSDNPTLYYRFNDMQALTNAGYPSSTFPVATNYGTLGTNANGVYQPGTTPGAAGPSYAGFGSNTAVALNGFFGAVDVGGGNITNNCPALNPVGKVPFTVVSWFQGNSADAPARYQDIVGHGNNSYRLALGSTCGENRFNPYNTELQFVNPTDMITNHAADNDGKWHMVAGVTDGTNAYMYLDGILVKSTNSVTGISIAGSSIDLLLGGDPQNTAASYNTADTDRTFDGQIAQVAIWNTNLTTAQIQSLFNAAEVPPSIVTEPVGATNNQGSTLTVTAVVQGSQLIYYQWYSTNGTPVPGQTNENLSFANATPAADGGYYLVATNAGGSVTSTVATVFVYGPPTVQSQSPTNIVVYAGSSPMLFVIAAGAPPILYQWYSNSLPIASATNSSYTVSNAQASATYTCALTNFVGGGPVDITPIVLTVLPDPTAPYPLAVLNSHPLAFYRLDESNGVTAFDYVGGYNGTYTNVYLDYSSPYDPTSDPTEGYAPGFGIASPNNSYVGWVPTNINFAAPTNVNAEFSLECWILQFSLNTDAGIISIGYGDGGEEFALDCGGNDPAHDLRFYVRDAGGTSEAATSAVMANNGVWHHVVAVCDEANAHVYLYVDGTNAATGNIPSKSGVLTSTQALTIGARQEGLGTQYDNQFEGSIDEVAVYNYALTAGEVQAHYLASGIAPVITELTPQDETTNVGASATFTAVVTGSTPLFYQWYDPNNNPISTNTTLVITNVQSSAQGQYTFVASNAYGTVTGYTYLSVVLGPPSIVQDITPLNQTVELYAGLDSLSYTVVVSGSEPFAYQWYQDGSRISGATNSTYTFTALPGTNTYYVTITNAYTASQAGGVPETSSTATVIGLPAPQLNPSNYAYRVEISFPGYQGEPLTNFPALITLNSSNITGLTYSQFATNGSDLRFTDASGTAMVPFEIDEWNDNGSSTIWVQIPVLNGTNIWAYWGYPNDPDIAPGSTNVWLDADYQIVYHLKQSALPFADSTGQYPATNGVAPTPTAGVVGHGASFAGANYLTPGPVTLSNQFTAYAWVYDTPGFMNEESIWVNQFGGYGSNGFSWFVNSYQTTDGEDHMDSGNGTGTTSYQGDDTHNASDTVSAGQWHFLVTTWNQPNSTVSDFVDGVPMISGTLVSDFALTNQLNLGAFLNPTLFFNGDMDEARIQYGLASTNWIKTTYLNMAESSFVGFSSVNLQPTLTISSSANGYVFTWPTNDGTFTLQTTTNLAAPANWTAVTTPPPVVTNGVWQQIVQPAAGSHFYRLEGQ